MQIIGQGPGNLVPNSEKRSYLCAGTIAAGNQVTLSGTTGYSIIQGIATKRPIGIAEEAGVSGDWITVTIGGYTSQTIVTDGNADEADILIAGAAGATVAVAPASLTAAQHGLAFGVALQADAATALSGCIVYKSMV